MTENLSIKTEVPREDIAVISILEGHVPVWSGTLTNFAPVQAAQFRIITTKMALEAGFKFMLQLSDDGGSVIADGTITAAGSPTDTFSGVVAYWSWPRDPSPPPTAA